MCNDHNFIAVIDKSLNISIFNFTNKDFKCKDFYFYNFDDIPKGMQKYRFFEMGYPYYSFIKGDYYVFTMDFGVLVINLKE